jgi:hypothetical protein
VLLGDRKGTGTIDEEQIVACKKEEVEIVRKDIDSRY